MSTTTKPQTYSVKLKNHREVAESTMAFWFEKPEGFTFKPGQFIELSLIDPPETDEQGNARAFSIASAPHENDLMIATRIREVAFKIVLEMLQPGSEVKLEGPFGDLVLHNRASHPAVILAGGIGITPFRSMVMHAAQEKLPHRIFLFYSNRRPEDTPFLDELHSLEQKNSNYKLIATMTQPAKSTKPWDGETGYIDQQMLSRYVKDDSPIYYIAGPPAMVHGLRSMLNGAGIDDDDIRAEEFAGY
jgi:ferredoxin-NADP reductase